MITFSACDQHYCLCHVLLYSIQHHVQDQINLDLVALLHYRRAICSCMEAIMGRMSLETLGSCTLGTGPGINPGSQVTQVNCP